MTYVTEREVVGGLLATFSAAPVLWPNSGLEPPEPTAAPAPPAAFVAAELEYASTELTDFAGGSRVDGAVALEIWVERRGGDDQVRDLFETLRTLFASGDASGMQFLEPRPGDPVVSDIWYGRPFRVPFVRFREGGS